MRRLSKTAAGMAGLVLSGCCCLFCGGDYPEAVDEGFVSLFNGTDLAGWEGATAVYGVDPAEPGVLQCFPDRKLPTGQRGDLVTAKSFGNFILRFEFMMPTNGNCGLGIRMESGKGAARCRMCELQLLGDGKQVAARKSDDLVADGSCVRAAGQWNFEEVKVIGSEVEVCLNGCLITKTDVSKFGNDGETPDGRSRPGLRNARGRIGWLGCGHNVKWRNIRIRELSDDAKADEVFSGPTAPRGFTDCFSGSSEQLRTNWKGVTAEDGFDNPIVRQKAKPELREVMQKIADLNKAKHWSVRDGSLHFDGGQDGCSLATKRDYADFELWADWRVLSIAGDAGLHLRGSPQVRVWDAHSQRRTGSGGLSGNRKNPDTALKIADRQVGDWNRFHVIMRGEKVTVWLNGERVVDNVTMENGWERSRPIFPKGPVELRGRGDPIEWRNIFIREL